MPVSTLRSPVQPGSATRAILGPAGNRVHKSQKQKDESLKKKAEDEKKLNKKLVSEKPKAAAAAAAADVLRKNGSADSSSDSSAGGGGGRRAASCNGSNGASCNGSNGGVKSLSKVKKKVNKMAKIVPDGVDTVSLLSPMGGQVLPIKRCDWITPNSEPLYIQFHDEEWGVPVRNDKKLFEILVLSQAMSELTWSTILCRRDAFRIMFEDFEPSSVANFDEKMLLSSIENGNSLLSELKLRAIVENANQFLKIQQEFGSFSNYCWRFVNNKPIKSGFRYARQVPAKTPKSELISKDLMRRGFRCVGPTVVYSFMQVAGLVNDHLLTCFIYNGCDSCVQKDLKPKLLKTDKQGEAAENTRASNES